MEKKKVIVYVDGYNFYYGLRNGGAKWRPFYWLDIVKFFERMMLSDQELVEVNYYSARPIDDQHAADNQDIFSVPIFSIQNSSFIWVDTRKRSSNVRTAVLKTKHTKRRSRM